MLIALYHLHLPKRWCMSFSMDVFTVTCKHVLRLSHCMWLGLLFETQTTGENKSLLTRGNILLGVPDLAIYLESVYLPVVSWPALSVKPGARWCVALPSSSQGARGAGAATGLSLNSTPWGRAGWQGGYAERVSSSLSLAPSLGHSHSQPWL